MRHTSFVFFIALLLALLQGCATLRPNLEAPGVRLISLALLPRPPNSLEQRFAVGLSVTNPNPVSLKPLGLHYGVMLEGQDIVSGVANAIPELPAYGEVEINLEASLDLIASARLVMALINTPQDALDYHLSARIALSRWVPAIEVIESGTINLTDQR